MTEIIETNHYINRLVNSFPIFKKSPNFCRLINLLDLAYDFKQILRLKDIHIFYGVAFNVKVMYIWHLESKIFGHSKSQ